VWHGKGDLFIYICSIKACTQCVYNVLKFVLGKFPFGGFCRVVASSSDSRLVVFWNIMMSVVCFLGGLDK
jgi:hypothetical protein